jgi:hypothetical protein
MKTDRRLIIMVSLLVLALVACGGVVACGGQQTDGVTTSEAVDAQAVLDAASAAMAEIAGFHFLYEVNYPESAPTVEGVQSVEADVDDAGSLRGTAKLILSGILISADFVVLSDIHYIDYPIIGWVQKTPAESPLSDIDLAGFATEILARVADPSYQATEQRGGATTYHIRGMVEGTDLEQVAGTVSTTGPFVTDLWIGVDNGLVYEVNVAGPLTTEEPEGTWRSIVFSNLDVAVDIEAPQ